MQDNIKLPPLKELETQLKKVDPKDGPFFSPSTMKIFMEKKNGNK